MPTPLSRTRITASSPSRLTVIRMSPPVSVYFAALLSRLTTTCSSRAGSAFHPKRLGRQRHGELVFARVHEGAGGLGGAVGDDAQLDLLLGQPQLALGNAADVQQVVHEAHHLPHLAVDDVAGVLDDRVVGPHLPQDVQGVENGRQGAAKFMGQQGHELFLAGGWLRPGRRPASAGPPSPRSRIGRGSRRRTTAPVYSR